MNFPFFSIFFLSVLTVGLNEIIKLENDDHIVCVTDFLDSTVSIEPPVLEDSRNTSVLLEDDSVWNGWLLKSSEKVVVPWVLDKRWEGEFCNHFYRSSTHNFICIYITLSVHSNNISFYIRESNETAKKPSAEVIINWSHHLMYPTSNFNASSDLYVYDDVDGATQYISCWKIHDYELRWADQISETPSTTPVSADDTSCLMFYTYLCSKCILDVSIVPRNKYSELIKTETISADQFSWQFKEITFDEPVDIILNRNRTDGRSDGQWAVDIRQCPTIKSNKVIHEVSLEKDVQPNTNRSCTVFKFNIEEPNDIFDCAPGKLGKECDITCEEILGPEMKYCEKHQLCDDSVRYEQNCFCAWGYHGPSCNETCPSGQWGLSCQNKCVGCDTCNDKTGECISHL